MKGFEISSDCMLEKSANVIAKELMKGSFVIGCDYKNKQLILENVFHYTKTQKRMEIYTLFPDKYNEKRQLKLETAFVFWGNGYLSLISIRIFIQKRFMINMVEA